jgi:hypothetical protein
MQPQTKNAATIAQKITNAPLTSLWQTDKIGLKVRMEVSWALCSATSLAFMNAVNW